uniref:Uncharacterized protein n=1 Tax=Plectus sambesii TaxID=2011161 RepID=A0A914WPU1_9BILA
MRSKIINNNYKVADERASAKTGDQITKYMDCAPLSDIMSVFKQVLVKLNTVCLAGNQGNNLYKTAIDGRFGKSAHEKEYSEPLTTLYAEDSALAFDMGASQDNVGFKKRAKCFEKGLSFVSFCPLNLDIARSGRLLIPGCSLQVTLVHQADSVRLMADPGTVDAAKSLKPKFVIEEISLIVCRVAITNEIYLETQSRQNRGDKAMYQFPRTACYGPTQVLRGLTELNVRLFHGLRPYALIIFFVKSAAANGSYRLNPQRTYHLNTIECCAYFNSYQYPQPSYRPDFEKVDVAPLYNALLKVWNVNKTYNCGFPLSAFNESQTYFAVPMDPNGSIETAASVPPVGDVSIKFRFSKETDQTYNMYWYVISHATVAIDASRVVTMNYIAEIPYFGLRANSTICFAGPAGSGKTTLIAALIKQRAFAIPDLGPIKKIVFCIGAQQKRITIFLVVHHLYSTTALRAIRLHCAYIFVFPTPSAAQQLRSLCREYFPGEKTDLLLAVFNCARSVDSRYLLIDNHSDTKHDQRLKSGLLNDEKKYIYQWF